MNRYLCDRVAATPLSITFSECTKVRYPWLLISLSILAVFFTVWKIIDAYRGWVSAMELNNNFQLPIKHLWEYFSIYINREYKLAKVNLRDGDCEPTHNGYYNLSDKSLDEDKNDLNKLGDNEYHARKKFREIIETTDWKTHMSANYAKCDTYINLVSTRLGNKCITNLQYVGVALSSLWLVSCVLIIGKLSGRLGTHLDAISLPFALVIIVSEVFFRYINIVCCRRISVPIVINVLDSMLDRNDILFQPKQDGENVDNDELWHRPVWVTNLLNPKKKRWEEDPNCGIQYSQAYDHATDAYAYMDIANSSLITSIASSGAAVTFVFITALTNIGSVLGIPLAAGLIALLGGSTGTITVSILNQVAAVNSTKRSRYILNIINKGFETVNQSTVETALYRRYSMFWLMLKTSVLLSSARSDNLDEFGYNSKKSNKFVSISVKPVRKVTEVRYVYSQGRLPVSRIYPA